jgi:DNA-binding NarL/FixJ family response regulator
MRCGTYIYMLTANKFQIPKFQILLADDHRVVREQLHARLQREIDFEIVGVASTSRETWEEMQAKCPHLLLIDPLMRDGLGLATLRQIHAKFPELVIVVLTAYVDTALNMQFQEMGIEFILTKGIPASELVGQLRAAYASASLHDSPEP